MLGVSPDTVRRWAEQRKLAHIRLPSGQLRFKRADVVKALRTIEAE